MTGSSLQIPSIGVDAILQDVRHYGEQGVESGALLLAPPGDTQVTTVALVGTTGVTRSAGRFVLTMPVIDQLFTYAEARGLQVVAHIHSHRHEAFLSPIDRTGMIRMPGFIAAVIPTFATPPISPADWGWWIYRAGDWRDHQPAQASDATVAHVVTVDADGVR